MKRKLSTRLIAATTVAAHVAAMLSGVARADTPAGAVAATASTQVYLAPNGVPVVNIANPNARGISHNQYTQYNVDSRGIVLNNGTVEQVSRQSQLAGNVISNVNLQSAASVILNEVVSPNRSTLAGYTEVLGSKADVIVANPFGITCNGCGFINTDRATLTTGAPTFGSAGELGFRVNGGDVLISGAGLNAGDQNFFNIITRALKVNGQVNARSLDVLTGTNAWDYATGSATPIAGSGSAPTFAMDSTALGGIYANRIRIVSTEAGVGVRALGDMAASSDDFTLNAAGKIELLGRVSAQRDVEVAYSGNASGGVGAITVGGLPVSAARNLTLAGGAGGIALSDGALNAGSALSLSGASLSDSSQSSVARFGGTVTSVDVAGAANIAGSVWGAGGALSVDAGSVSLTGANTRLYSFSNSSAATSSLALRAHSGDLDLGDANITTPAQLLLASDRGSVLIGAGANPVQATDITVRAGVAVSNAGSILAANGLSIDRSGDASIALSNTGLLQGGAVTVGATPGAVDLQNGASGTILAESLAVQAGELRNSGLIQSAHGASIAAGSFSNDTATARFLSSTQAGSASVITVSGAFDNAGTVSGTSALQISASNLNNAAGGTVSSQSSLAVLTSADVVNDGMLDASKGLSLNASSVTNRGQLRTAGALSLDAQDFTNAGSVESADTLGLTTGSLTNSGSVKTAGTLNASTQSLVNSGSVESAGALSLTTQSLGNTGSVKSGSTLTLNASNLTNTASIEAGGSLELVAPTITNSGTIKTAGRLAISQGAAGSPDTRQLTNADTGKLLANTLSIDAGVISNSGLIQAASGSTFNAVSLNNATDSAKIIFSTATDKAGTVTLAGALANFGVLHSFGDLSITAGSIQNSGSAGLSSLGALSLASSTGDITNAGLVYGAGSLAVSTPLHAFINPGNVISGVAASGVGNMAFNVDTFTNTGVITSEGDMLINARVFQNDPATGTAGLPTIVWGPDTIREPTTDTGCTQYQNVGFFDICVQTATYTVPVFHQIGDSGDFHCDDPVGHTGCAHSRVYEVFYTSEQQLVGGHMPTTTTQLIANGDFTLNYTGSARNVASIISGDNVTIQGAPGAGAFSNQDFHLERRRDRKVIWVRSTDGDSYRVPLDKAQYDVMTDVNADEPGGNVVWYIVPDQMNKPLTYLAGLDMAYVTDSDQYEVIPGTTSSAGIFARNLASYHGPALNVQAGMKSTMVNRPTVSQSPESGAGAGFGAGAGAGFGAGANSLTPASRTGLDLSLPTNPNGFFVPTKGSGAAFLIETNPLFTSGEALGSNYLAGLLGYNVDTLEKRLGDANYEAKLIREQLIAQTGSNILAGYANEQAQIKGLMDNAATELGDLGLTIGKPLTAEQAASLKQDLVWMEERVVSGQKVLVPVVYLAAATRDEVSTGAVISAKNVSLGGGAVTNTGGTIKAGEQLAVETTGDITNRSGTISGGNVVLRSTDGSVVNETIANTTGNDTFRSTDIGDTAAINAKNGLTIDAAKDVTVKGAVVDAGGSASIGAGGNVVIDTIQNRTATSTASSSSGTIFTGGSSSTSTNTQETKQIGSQVNAGSNLAIKSGGDTRIGGSQLNAGGNADVRAGGNLNLVDRQDEKTVTTRTESTGNFTSDGSSVGLESSSVTNTKSSSTSVGSSIRSGGNGNLQAGETVTVKGSDVDAGGNLSVSGKDIQVLAGTNTTTDTTHEERSSTTLGGTANADTVGAAVTYKTSTSDTSTTTNTARGSTLRSGGDLTRNASGTITDVGTQIDAGGDFAQKATTIDSRAAENTTTTTSSSQSQSYSVGVSIDYGAGTAVSDAKNGSTAGAVSASSGPTAGTNIKYHSEESSANSASSKAVVSTIKAGGKVTSESSGSTTLEGTQITSGGDANIAARDLNIKAAKDTTTSSESASHIDAGYRGSVDVTGTPSGTLSGGYGDSSKQSAESKAVVGTIKSGGNVNVTTTGNARLEGTQIQSKGDTNIDAGGSVAIDAARNTSSASASSFDVAGSVTVGKGNGGVSGSLSTSDGSSNSSTAVTGSVAAGGNLNVRAGKDVTTEGTDLSAGKDATVSAGGTVDLKDAVSTSESRSESTSASVSVSGSKGSGSGKGGRGGTRRTEPGKGDPGNVLSGGGFSSSSEASSTTTSKGSTVKAGGTVTVEEKSKPATGK
jgi:filamentous hemagglutinin family protein